MLPRLHARLDAFRSAQDGTIAIIFALTVFVVIMMTGLAIDVARLMHANTKLTAAADAAALAAARGMRDERLTDEEVRDLAEQYFTVNMKGSGGNYAVVKTFDVTVDRERNTIAVDVDTDVPTLFAQVAGIQKIALPKSSLAVYEGKDVELGLQLDVTGSMRGRKLADLKSAVNDLLGIMLPDEGTTNRVRIGFAPYSAGVNAGPYAALVSDNRATDGCVYERLNVRDQASEAAATGALALKVRADLGRGAQACPSNAQIQPLSNDKAMLIRTINAYTDGGSTAGHLGSAWAWYLVSPEWSGIWPGASKPAPYRDGKTLKAVVLMTDGIYNTIGGINQGDRSPTATQSTRAALDTCEAMRDAGVIVYTVAFEAPADARATLRSCASGDSKFFDASNGDQLRDAFRTIATELNNLRLAR